MSTPGARMLRSIGSSLDEWRQRKPTTRRQLRTEAASEGASSGLPVEGEKATAEERFLERSFRVALPTARNGNLFGIAVMLGVIILEDERANAAAGLFLAANVFGLVMISYCVPRAERRHGMLFARRMFLRASLGNVVFTFCVAIPGATSQLELGACSPLLAVLLSSCASLVAGMIHLVACPLSYRCVVSASMIASSLFAPSYTTLGHTNEVVLIIMGCLFGELVGHALQRAFLQSFATLEEDKRALDTRLAELDAEKTSLKVRLEQIHAEKERLTYELLMEQQPPSASRRGVAGVPQESSAASESELGEWGELGNSFTNLVTDPDRGHTPPFCRSRSRSSMASDDVPLSSTMRQRLDATLDALE